MDLLEGIGATLYLTVGIAVLIENLFGASSMLVLALFAAHLSGAGPPPAAFAFFVPVSLAIIGLSLGLLKVSSRRKRYTAITLCSALVLPCLDIRRWLAFPSHLPDGHTSRHISGLDAITIFPDLLLASLAAFKLNQLRNTPEVAPWPQ